MIHNLKIRPLFFEDVLSGKKTFEVRKNDRDYQVHDELFLNEYDLGYTGRLILCKVTYIFYGGAYGLDDNYVIMAIVPLKFNWINTIK